MLGTALQGPRQCLLDETYCGALRHSECGECEEIFLLLVTAGKAQLGRLSDSLRNSPLLRVPEVGQCSNEQELMVRSKGAAVLMILLAL